GVHVEQQQEVDAGQHFDKVVVEIARARVTVRLIDHHETTLWPAVTNRADVGSHFSRVVAVVVHEHHFAVASAGEFALHIETTTNALEVLDTLLNVLVTQLLISCDYHGSRGIQHVMQTRHVDGEFERLVETRTLHCKLGDTLALGDRNHTEICVFAETIGQHRTRNARQDLPHHRIIDAHHTQAVTRQVGQEVDERLIHYFS